MGKSDIEILTCITKFVKRNCKCFIALAPGVNFCSYLWTLACWKALAEKCIHTVSGSIPATDIFFPSFTWTISIQEHANIHGMQFDITFKILGQMRLYQLYEMKILIVPFCSTSLISAFTSTEWVQATLKLFMSCPCAAD